MDTELFAYVWQYKIDPRYSAEFMAAYGPDGEWATLFQRDPKYIETRLFRQFESDDCFMTIDYWTSKNGRDSFQEKFAVQFQEIDERCETYTLEEVFVGDYVTVVRAAT